MSLKITPNKPDSPRDLSVHLDDVLLKFNIFGRYNVGVLFMITLVFTFDVIICCQYIFTAEKVNYWCTDERFGNDSCATLRNSTDDVCTEWVYEDPHSFVAEFDLACQEWKRTSVGTAQAFGYGAGLLIIGPLSDRIGRKAMIIITAILSGIIGVAKSFSNNYWVFIVLEFLGSFLGNSYSPAYILLIEMVAHEKRVLAKALTMLGQTIIGYSIVTLAAWKIGYWRHLLLAYYSPAIIFISFIFLLDESPRWLLNKGRKDEATAILKKAAKFCKTEVIVKDLDTVTFEQQEDVGVIKALNSIFTSNILMKRFFICLILWTVGVFGNFGTRINSVLLPGNKYVNFAFVGVAAVPARLLTYWFLKRFTRKTSMINTFVLCAIVYLVQPFIPENVQWLSLSLFMAGILFVKTVFAVIYIFTSELFPTCARNSTHALCSSLSRVGSIVAPQTPLLMVYWHGLPSLTFSAAALLGGAVALLAPSTVDDTLPDNVNQAELIGKQQSNNVTNNINVSVITSGGCIETEDLTLKSDRNKESDLKQCSDTYIQ